MNRPRDGLSPIKDHENLIRDNRSGAVINNDSKALKKSLRQKEMVQKVLQHDEDIADIKGKLDQIIGLLQDK